MDEHKSEAETEGANLKTSAAKKLSRSIVFKSSTTDHVVHNDNHVIDWDEAKIVGKETNKFKRWVKEAIAIRKQPANMNRDEGSFT